jgi:hypothetical protein
MSLTVMGCSSPTAEEATSGEVQTAESERGAAPSTPQDLTAAFEAEYGSEDWYAHVQGVRTEQILLAEVTRVDTDLAPGDPTAGEIAGQMSGAMASIATADVLNVAVADAEGNFITSTGWGSAFEEAVDAPPTPTSAEAIKPWLDEVFGTSGEEWYAHVESVGVSDDVAGWSGTTMIVVNTDFAERSPEANAAATTIGQAVALSGQTISDNYAVFTASGEHILSGGVPAASWLY